VGHGATRSVPGTISAERIQPEVPLRNSHGCAPNEPSSGTERHRPNSLAFSQERLPLSLNGETADRATVSTRADRSAAANVGAASISRGSIDSFDFRLLIDHVFRKDTQGFVGRFFFIERGFEKLHGFGVP